MAESFKILPNCCPIAVFYAMENALRSSLDEWVNGVAPSEANVVGVAVVVDGDAVVVVDAVDDEDVVGVEVDANHLDCDAHVAETEMIAEKGVLKDEPDLYDLRIRMCQKQNRKVLFIVRRFTWSS